VPSPDGVTIIPTTLDPHTKSQEVKITYVHALPTAGGSMTLKSSLPTGLGTVEADVVGERSPHLTQFESEPVPRDPPQPASPPEPLIVPDGLLRPIIVPHEILHPSTQ